MILTAGLFNSGIFKGGIFNVGLFKSSSTVSIVSLLFGAIEPGLIYDISDFSTMFQDSAGTTPVTSVSQPVGKILDISGNNNHAYQATTAYRPVLRQDGGGHYYLEFDGINNWLSTTTAVNLSASDKLSLFVGLKQATTGVSRACIAELGTDYNGGAGRFVLFNPSGSAAAENDFRVKATNPVTAYATGGYTPPVEITLTGLCDISGDSLILRRNAVQIDAKNSDFGAGSFASDQVMYIGRRAGSTNPHNGNIYSIIVRGALTSGDRLSAAEAYVNSKTGAY